MRFNSPRPSFRQPAPYATGVRGTVKWFNATKGFGFVAPSDGSPDAFLHISVIEPMGHASLPEGATVVVDLVQGQKGPQVGALHEVDLSTASPRAPRAEGPRQSGGFAPRGPRPSFRDSGPTEEVSGTVKWFNTQKGFGFIAPDSGSKDVFVHVSAVERSGLDGLPEGARVRAEVRQGMKGPEAVSVSLD